MNDIPFPTVGIIRIVVLNISDFGSESLILFTGSTLGSKFLYLRLKPLEQYFKFVFKRMSCIIKYRNDSNFNQGQSDYFRVLNLPKEKPDSWTVLITR